MYFVDRNSLYTSVIFARKERKSQAQHEGEGHAGGQITPSVPRAGRDSPFILNTEQQNRVPEDLSNNSTPQDRVNKVVSLLWPQLFKCWIALSIG